MRKIGAINAWNFAKRTIVRLFSLSYHRNKRRWKKLKGKFAGKRVFLIGNGPSLNKTPLYLLKDEYTLCFNRFDLMTERFCWYPTFFAMADTTVAEDIQDIVKKTIEKTKYAFFLSVYKGWSIEKVLPQKDNILYFYHEFHDFSKKLPFTKGGSTVAIEGLQILNYLGFDEIVLIGVDMNYVIHKSSISLLKRSSGAEVIQSTADDDPNHFDPRYFGKGAKYSQPNEYTMNEMLKSLDEISLWFKENTSTKVYNAGYDSKVNSFERKDFMEILNYTDEKIDLLFLETVKKTGFSSINDLLIKAISYESVEEFDDNIDVFSLPTEEAVKIIKSTILSYVPIGPYKDKIYFVKRNG